MYRQDDDIAEILAGCLRRERSSQRALYQRFYAYGLNICRHYAKTTEEAREILNDGFVKVFARLEQFRSESSFKAYFRKILVHAAIDYFRRYHKHEPTLEIVRDVGGVDNDAIAALSLDETLELVQQLPAAYRLTFNLYVVEGYKHHEIAEQLGTSVGTSKSNLSKAKQRLRQLINARTQRDHRYYRQRTNDA